MKSESVRKYPDFQKYEIYYAPAISLHDLEILPDRRKVYCGKQEVSLTTKEFNLLCYFVANAGRVLTYEQIYQNVWATAGQGEAAVVTTQRTAVAARQAAIAAAKAAKAVTAAVKAVIAATKALVSAILAGGWIVMLILVLVILFGALFSVVGGSNSVPLPLLAHR